MNISPGRSFRHGQAWVLRILLLAAFAAGAFAQVPVITAISAPRQVVATGQSLTLSVTANGATFCQWQRNGRPMAGATSTSYTITSASPVRDSGWYRAVVTNSSGAISSPVVFVSVALKDGYVTAYGDNLHGQTNIPGGLTGLVAVAAGFYQTLALKSDGTVVAWGPNYSGESTIPAGLSDVVAVAAGGSHSLALKSDGTVVAWGYPGSGRTTIPAGLSGVVAVAAGGGHNLAVKNDGTVVAWGYNEDGQTTIPVGLSNVVAVAAGSSHSVALKSDGTVVAWGSWRHGETFVPAGLSGVVAVAAGELFSLALKSDGTVVIWGYTANGALNIPVGLSGVVAITAGSIHGVALKSDGTVVVWGYNSSGQTIFPSGLNDVVGVAAGGVFSVLLRDLAGDLTPTITTQPITQAVAPGGSLTLKVVATGSVPLSYQWSRNRVAIAGATTASYSIGNAQLADAGRYSVSVSNLTGTSISAPAQVNLTGLLWEMGGNYYGGLGDGSTIQRNLPVLVAGDVSAVAAGGTHSLFIKIDGTLWATGYNLDGRLGDGTTISRSSPVHVAGGVCAVAAGGSHSLFIKADGTLWAMGSNSFGQLGDGTTISRSLPVRVADGVSAIAAGSGHSLFLKIDGTLWAMGYNINGQLGNGTTIAQASPIQVAGGVCAMAAGVSHSLYLKTDGTMWATGANSDGQLGDGTTTDRNTPVQMASGVCAVATGWRHSLFLKANGTLWAMGNNYSGQLGDGTTTQRITPVQVATDVNSVGAGWHHSLFLRTDGHLWAMGFNWKGQLGDGTTSPRTTPVQVAANVLALAAGEFESAFIQTAGGGVVPTVTTQPAGGAYRVSTPVTLSVVATGSGPLDYRWHKDGVDLPGERAPTLFFPVLRSTAFGNYTVVITNRAGSATSATATLTLQPVPAITTQPTRQTIVPGGVLTLSVVATGNGALTYQWFRNGMAVAGATDARYSIGNAQLADAGRYHVTVTDATGTNTSAPTQVNLIGLLWATGNNVHGQLGEGTTTQRNSPVLITESVSAVAAGPSHTLFLGADGTLWAMGDNSDGQLGDGTTISRSSPVRVAVGVSAMAAGWSHSLYLKTDGSLWAMGWNLSGQLGDGTTTSRLTPVQVAGDVSAVAAGGSHTIFLKVDGTLWAMGGNEYGQLGDRTTLQRTSPVLVAGGVGAVAAGSAHSLYLKTDGTLWAMGSNEYGQLGDHTTVQRTSPVLVADGVSAMAAGWFHSLHLKTDGTLWAMGSNTLGQLGDGTTAWQNSLVQVAAGVGALAAGAYHNLFWKTDGTLWAMGFGTYGQFGDGATTGSTAPVLVAHDVLAAAAGEQSSYFIQAAGVGTIPTVTAQPSSRSFLAGASGTVSVAATGSGPLDYRWRKDGVDLAGARTATLSLPFLRPIDAGSYVVMISNRAGSVTSSAATLTVYFNPVVPVPVITSATTASATVGTAFSFQVTASNSQGSYTATGLPADLTFNPATGGISGTPTAAGSYEVTLTAANAGGTSATATLSITVRTPAVPEIATHPVTQVVLAGSSAIFTVAATNPGSGALTYRWYYTLPGSPTPQALTDVAGKFAGTQTASFTVSNVQVSDTGDYVCVVSNSAGLATSQAAPLAVVERLVQLVSQAAAAGSAVVVPIRIVAQGDENAVSFTLEYAPAKLTYTDARIVGTDASTGSLVRNATQAASGKLSLTISKPAGEVFGAGSRTVVNVAFTVAAGAAGGEVIPLAFTDSLVVRKVTNIATVTLPAIFVDGGVSVASDLEGDINGDGAVDGGDWVKLGRIVVGLEPAPAAGVAFMRADVAPRATKGDGAIDGGDWVQLGRYVVGLDPLQSAGGPTDPPVIVPAGFALIPAGTFTMGSIVTSNTADTADEITDAPPHAVTLSAFFLAKTETTWAEWVAVRDWAVTHGYTDLASVGSGQADTHPVQMVSWWDVVKWCNAKSEKDGLVPVYYTNDAQTTVYRTGSVNVTNTQVKWAANGYRLPTEAEWEYAARGGLAGKRFPWGDTITHSQANYLSSASYYYDVSPTRGYHPTYATGAQPYTSPAGAFAANGYGLFDMAGNVMEWCWDWYGSYGSAAVSAPLGATSGRFRVFRGGSWYINAYFVRSAYRSYFNPVNPYYNMGFRPARSLVP